MKTQSLGSLIKRGSHYYAMWRSNGKQFCKVLRNDSGAPCSDRREAESAKAKLMGLFVKQNERETLERIQARISRVNGDIEALSPGMTLSETWSRFAKPNSGRKPCEKSTLGAYEAIWTQFETWVKENHSTVKTLSGVIREVAAGYLDSLIERGVSNATRNYHLATIKYIFGVLRSDESSMLKDNVWMNFKPLAVIRESRRELTIDELKTVCSAAQGEMKTMFCVGLYTGLRLGDCATLEWSEVDLRRNIIKLIPNKIRRKKGIKGLVQIPIHPVLRNTLTSLTGSKTQGFVLPDTAKLYQDGCRSRIANHITEHFENCGIRTKRDRENGRRRAVEVGFHSLRHSFISMCAMNAVPLTVVQSLVGHAAPLMTEHYSHSNRLAEQQAVAALPVIAIN